MKVLDLLCSESHAFEGWFGSEEDFQSQQARGLVQCPLCGSAQVRKLVSAPRLSLSRAQADAQPQERGARPEPTPKADVASAVGMPEPVRALHAAWLQWARQVVEHTEDVGVRFAAEARRMHYGETPERGIRGQSSPDEVAQLLEEGIEVVPLLLPDAAKNPLQ